MTQKERSRKSYLKNRSRQIERSKTWRRENPERSRQSKRKWNAAHPTYHTESRLRKIWNLSLAQYSAMLLKQNGVCAICHGIQKGHYRLAVDHCHSTGIIRGLLCTACNTAIGLMKDDPLRLRLAADYVEHHVTYCNI